VNHEDDNDYEMMRETRPGYLENIADVHELHEV